jgi:hypothetical protein
MSATEQRQINWNTAEIVDGALTVELTGDAPKGWGKRFAGVLALLDQGGGGWGEIKLRKSTVKVTEVEEGSEDSLKHLLESVLQQVNTDLDLSASEASHEQLEEDQRTQRDRRMTDAFRGFAEASRHDSQ